MKQILITGGDGYIAKSLKNTLTAEFDITTISRADFDLTESEAVNTWFKDKLFDVVIHTAAGGGSRLKHDTSDVIYQNLQMFYNIYNNRSRFKKFIEFGSGAEFTTPVTPYGLSKKVISDIIKQHKMFYNLRLFGVFDSNEHSTRFIKRNILNYINDKSIEIYKDKFMDFIYMADLIYIVKQCVYGNVIGGVYNGVYKEMYKLSDIAKLINNLDAHTVDVNLVNTGLDAPYKSNFTGFESNNLMGLKKGIQKTYISLKR